MYIVMGYSRDMEVYRVIVGVGLRLVSMLRAMNGVCSVMIYMIL